MGVIKMIINIEHLGVCVTIDANKEQISIIEDNTNSKMLFNMAFKAILHKVNIDVNNYRIVNKTNN